MNNFVGTRQILRLIIRRDRFRLIAWVILLALLPIATANAFFELAPTEAARESLAATAASNPAFIALLGPIYGSSIGALTAWRVGTFGAVLVALMAILTVTRHTRTEEETGRADILGSTVVGRHALPAAAFTIVALVGLTVGVITAGGLSGLGLPLAESVAFGIGFMAVAVVFAAVAVTVAQISESATTTRGLGVGLIGLAFVLRAIGDSTDAGFLAWLSPIGWFTRLRPFADEAWWVLSLYLALTLIALATAFALAIRRDIGAGLFPTRPGPPHAHPGFDSAFDLARRLQVRSMIGWTVGVAGLGIVFGAISQSIGDLIASNPQFAAIFERLGGEKGVTETFFVTAVGTMALIAAGYATRSVLVLQTEEDRRRADPILATAVPRTRWMGSHLIFALGGSAIMLILAGIVTAIVYGASRTDPAVSGPSVVTIAIGHILPVWVIAGLAAALFGVAPRLTQLAWVALILFAVIGQIGQLLDLPEWVINLSPFAHVPEPSDPDLLPGLVLAVIAAALIAAGHFGIRNRDIR